MCKILDLEDIRYEIVHKNKENENIDSCLFCDFAEDVYKGYVKCKLEKIIGLEKLVKQSFCFDEEGTYFKIVGKIKGE